MNICINENIKRLRREKNITQEKLAEYLNISTQAVSKWERNESYPDITMVIPIASYFNVSTDELFGFDTAKNEIKIQNYLEENQKLLVRGEWGKAVELITEAHKEFPNDFRLTNWYMQEIIGGSADNPVDAVLLHADELTVLCERILNECTVDCIRNEAVNILAKINKAQGNVEKALELLGRFPDWFTTKNQKSEQLFDKRTDEWWHWIRANFYDLADFAHNKLLKIIWYADKPFEERLKETNLLIEYLKKIYEETEHHLFLEKLICASYSEIGRQCHIEGRHDEVSKYFSIGLEYAKKIDKSDIESDLFNKKFLWYENNPWLEESRKTDNFKEMLEKYRPFLTREPPVAAPPIID